MESYYLDDIREQAAEFGAGYDGKYGYVGDPLQEALDTAWVALLSVPAYVERYQRDGGAFDANID